MRRRWDSTRRCDHRLRCEVLHQSDLLVREWPDFLAVNREAAEQVFVLAQGHDQDRAKPTEIDRSTTQRVPGFVGVDRRYIGEVNQRLTYGEAGNSGVRAGDSRSDIVPEDKQSGVVCCWRNRQQTAKT